jgi:hypothetical protein
MVDPGGAVTEVGDVLVLRVALVDRRIGAAGEIAGDDVAGVRYPFPGGADPCPVRELPVIEFPAETGVEMRVDDPNCVFVG